MVAEVVRLLLAYKQHENSLSIGKVSVKKLWEMISQISKDSRGHIIL